VDSVYQHVLAWREALEKAGIELSVWWIHRRIGMSGGLFVNALLRETGHRVTAEESARLQRRHAEAYVRQIAQVRPLPGARELLAYLSQMAVPWAIATSGRLEGARPAPERSASDSSRAVTGKKSSNGLARTACTRTRPTYYGTSTRSESARPFRRRPAGRRRSAPTRRG
jgi:beta-phosphoglucomutase-like phosphatase (HAD superfamily)